MHHFPLIALIMFSIYTLLLNNLFHVPRRVGRIELDEEDFPFLTKYPTLDDILRQAHSSGFKLIYLFGPSQAYLGGKVECRNFDDGIPEGKSNFASHPLPGLLADHKTTYSASIISFDRAALCTQAFITKGFRIRKYDANSHCSAKLLWSEHVAAGTLNNSMQLPSPALKRLAVESGGHSRFKVDEGIPEKGFVAMFEAWITNSVNKTIADEVFVAVDVSKIAGCESHADTKGQEIGFITLRKRGNSVSIGLLAVSEFHRRRGIASALLSRAALWAIEELGSGDPGAGTTGADVDDATLTVVTQGGNTGACACYEHFGFTKIAVQEVRHVWLPQHLTQYVSRADTAPIPFCRQHLTGKELTYTAQVISGGLLDSAAHFTMMCSAKIHDILCSSSSSSCPPSMESGAAGSATVLHGQQKPQRQEEGEGKKNGTERVVMVPSGTAALEMAALLCDLKPGDEVIMPSFTFSSTANAFVLRGAVPVFVDVRTDTLNIDETLIEEAVTGRTRAICVVHYAGVPCEMDTICDIATRHRLLVIEDAAQGIAEVVVVLYMYLYMLLYLSCLDAYYQSQKVNTRLGVRSC